MTLKLRNRTYALRVRVPARYRHLHRSSHVWRSLGTDSLDHAKVRELEVRAQLMAEWAAQVGADDASPANHYRRIADLAAARGYVYQTSLELAAGPLERAVERIEAVEPLASKETMSSAAMGHTVQRARYLPREREILMSGVAAVPAYERPQGAERCFKPRPVPHSRLRLLTGRGGRVGRGESTHSTGQDAKRWWISGLVGRSRTGGWVCVSGRVLGRVERAVGVLAGLSEFGLCVARGLVEAVDLAVEAADRVDRVLDVGDEWDAEWACGISS